MYDSRLMNDKFITTSESPIQNNSAVGGLHSSTQHNLLTVNLLIIHSEKYTGCIFQRRQVHRRNSDRNIGTSAKIIVAETDTLLSKLKAKIQQFEVNVSL